MGISTFIDVKFFKFEWMTGVENNGRLAMRFQRLFMRRKSLISDSPFLTTPPSHLTTRPSARRN
jgi:hypothetical protein